MRNYFVFKRRSIAREQHCGRPHLLFRPLFRSQGALTSSQAGRLAVSLVRLLLPVLRAAAASGRSGRAVTLGFSLGAVNLAAELLRCVLGATRENLRRS